MNILSNYDVLYEINHYTIQMKKIITCYRRLPVFFIHEKSDFSNMLNKYNKLERVSNIIIICDDISRKHTFYLKKISSLSYINYDKRNLCKCICNFKNLSETIISFSFISDKDIIYLKNIHTLDISGIKIDENDLKFLRNCKVLTSNKKIILDNCKYFKHNLLCINY